MILVPSASELLKSPSPKKPSQQKTNLPSAAKQSPHHSTSSPNKRPAPSSPSKSPLAKKKQKMVSFKDIRPIQANGTFHFFSISHSCGISNISMPCRHRVL